MKWTPKDMPSSPKSFHPSRKPWLSYNHRTSISICFLLIGIFGFILGFVSILRPVSSYNDKCRSTSEPLSVSVVWGKSSGNSGGDLSSGGSDENRKRRKVMGFVGIQTGFGSVGRRRSLRKTWMPSDRQGLRRLEEATGLAFRFAIGRTSDKSKTLELKREVEEYDDFILLDVEEEYSKLPYKTLAFFKAAYGLFESDFYVKADDDIYLRPDRLSLLLAKERSDPRTYLGCMKKGPVFTDPKLKWYEPLAFMLGKEYFLHAYGPLYALSSEVVSSLVALRNDSLHMFSNEDVTIGAWMLAMNVNHEDNRAMCESDCTPSFVAVWDIPACSGLCDPEKKLLKLHEKESCVNTPTLESDDDK